MARPENISEINEEDRFVSIGNIDIDKIKAHAPLLKAYVSFLEAVEKHGGHTGSDYRGTSFEMPKTKKELEDQLRSDQYAWDSALERYNRAVLRDDPDTKPLSEWEREHVVTWAAKENRPNPYDVFASTDEELETIRKSLNMEA